jgi:uncharacterized protein
MKIAVTGGTGFIGSRLVQRLLEEGHQVLLLARNPEKAKQQFPQADVVAYSPKESGPWQDAIAGCDGVVNLAGEPIAERWTDSSKQELMASRKLGTEKIVEAIAKANPRPTVLVNASAIGYYGTSETEVFTETSPPGADYLAEICQAWESAAQKVSELGVRLVIPRIGIVLGPEGGALAKMAMPFRLFAGGPIGTGKQWVSWIHRDDLVAFILKALTDTSLQGIYNATAPEPVRMSDFCNILGTVLHRPSWLPVPGFALELLLGEGAQLVLEGQHVQCQHTQVSGFQFQYRTLRAALTQIFAA